MSCGMKNGPNYINIEPNGTLSVSRTYASLVAGVIPDNKKNVLKSK